MALSEDSTTALTMSDSPLTASDAYDLLVGDDDVVACLPFRPTGRSVDKYFSQEGPQDWRADGHRWVNQGTTSLPRRNPLLKKNYFYIQRNITQTPLADRHGSVVSRHGYKKYHSNPPSRPSRIPS